MSNPNALPLVVYRIDNDAEIHSSIEKWTARLCEIAKADDFSVEVVYNDDRAAACLAPFDGRPFIVAGASASLRELFFSRLTPQALHVLEDCAYFWVLSDLSETDPPFEIGLQPDRKIGLSWEAGFYNIVATRLRQLARFPGLAGLSVATFRLRDEITAIAQSDQGAFSPVLILGGTGTGKELVCRALWNAFTAWKGVEKTPPGQSGPSVLTFNRGTKRLSAVACGWFTEHLLQDQLFGHEKGAFTGADRMMPGILETNVDGAVFLDDFDAALAGVLQRALLRVMAADRTRPGTFSRLGGTTELPTNAWLIFATNVDIADKIGTGEIRPDFVYRFEERVLQLLPLGERPADIPPIARRLWGSLWHGYDRQVNLTAAHIGVIMALPVKWEANVRQLRALLSLAAAGVRSSNCSLRTALTNILNRGNDYTHWVQIVVEKKTGSAVPPSYVPAGDVLTEHGLQAFTDLCAVLPKTRAKKGTHPVNVRLENILVAIAKTKEITVSAGLKINGGSRDTAKKDLISLVGYKGRGGLLHSRDDNTFTPIAGMFRRE